MAAVGWDKMRSGLAAHKWFWSQVRAGGGGGLCAR